MKDEVPIEAREPAGLEPCSQTGLLGSSILATTHRMLPGRQVQLPSADPSAKSSRSIPPKRSGRYALPGVVRVPLPATEHDLWQADPIVALKEVEHRPLLEEQFPAWTEQVEFWHVHDLDGATPEDRINPSQLAQAPHQINQGAEQR